KYLRASLLEYRDIECLLSCPALSVVGTIPTPALRRLQATGDDYARAAQMMFTRSETIEVPGLLTQGEREAAQALYPNLPLGPGLGESFVAAPELRARLDFVDEDTAGSVALALAAIDIQ